MYRLTVSNARVNGWFYITTRFFYINNFDVISCHTLNLEVILEVHDIFQLFTRKIKLLYFLTLRMHSKL